MKNEYIEKLTEAIEAKTETRRGYVILANMYGWSQSECFEALTSTWSGSVRPDEAEDFVAALKESGIRDYYVISDFSNQLEGWVALEKAGLKFAEICELDNPRYHLEMKKYGSSDRVQKLPALRFRLETATEIDSIETLSKVITAVVNRAVVIGTENTSSGNYFVDAHDFGDLITEADFIRYFDLIAHELEQRPELLDLIVSTETYELDMNFGLEHCKAYEWCEGDEDIFECSYEEWLNKPAKPVSQPLSMARLAEIGEAAISSTLEWFDHPENELGGSFGMSEEEMKMYGISNEEGTK